MHTVQIIIGPNGATPNPAKVKHTERVEFVLSGRTDTVTLSFKDGVTPLELDQGGQLTYPSSITLSPSLNPQDYGIAHNTPKGPYCYRFPLYVEQAQSVGTTSHGDQPTTSGELDVTTDPEPHR